MRKNTETALPSSASFPSSFRKLTIPPKDTVKKEVNKQGNRALLSKAYSLKEILFFFIWLGCAFCGAFIKKLSINVATVKITDSIINKL